MTKRSLTKNKKTDGLKNSPELESYKTSADNGGSAAFEDKLVRSPSRYGMSLVKDLAVDICKDGELPKVLCTFGMSLVKDLAVDDCKDSELPKVLCTFSFMGL